MAKVFKIAVSQNSKGKMESVESIKVILGKGIVNDRKFKDNNDKKKQITLIEIENIEYYNHISGTSIPPIEFRRNIITQGIRLNELIGKEITIGEIKIKAHDLCRPCKFLQDSFKQKNVIKELLFKGGLRCELLNNGKISVGDEVKS
tara:strand:- start:209 stop:649 length:441 start_codon:yes stop_codon:yes gene_type:complete